MSKREFLKIIYTMIKTKNFIKGIEEDTEEIPHTQRAKRRNNEKRHRTLRKERD